jgi:hypothetical protein
MMPFYKLSDNVNVARHRSLYGKGRSRRFSSVEPSESCEPVGSKSYRTSERSDSSQLPAGAGRRSRSAGIDDDLLKAKAAARRNIPRGFSLRRWDPEEQPFLVAGTAFDANSLGKWIFDWACFAYGRSCPLIDVAGDFWVMLIRLTGGLSGMGLLKRWEMTESLYEALAVGEKLLSAVAEHVAQCERSLRSTKEFKQRRKLGQESATAFVKAFLGSDKYLSRTEDITHDMRDWQRRYNRCSGK